MERHMGFEFRGEVVFPQARVQEAEKTKTEGSQCAHRASLCFSRRSKEARQDRGSLLPIRGGFLQLAVARLGEFVKLCLAVIFRDAPPGTDKTFLLELE